MIGVILDGQVINIGPWQAKQSNGQPNPLPAGAVQGDFDIYLTADGRYVLGSSYEDLRRAEYPPIGDQLDALYHAGVFPPEMAEQIAAIKAKYPKP